MMKNILTANKPDEYINSSAFLEDYLKQTGFENLDSNDRPIHFEIQNKVYEVPAKGGTTSLALFNPTDLSSYAEFEKEIAKDYEDEPIIVAHAAAPDRRRFEGAFDKLCSKDELLRNPDDPNTLKVMIESGIRKQCKEAIRNAKLHKKPYLIFVLPGCGAFGNPIHTAAEIFLREINKQKDVLEEYHIPFCIVEKNRENHAVLRDYLSPPTTPERNWKFTLACCTSFLIAPLLYIAWFKHKESEAQRYQSFAFFSEKTKTVDNPEIGVYGKLL